MAALPNDIETSSSELDPDIPSEKEENLSKGFEIESPGFSPNKSINA